MRTKVTKYSHLSSDDLKKIQKYKQKIKATGIANKNKCSERYVNMVLSGTRNQKSEKAKNIILDAYNLLKALEI